MIRLTRPDHLIPHFQKMKMEILVRSDQDLTRMIRPDQT